MSWNNFPTEQDFYEHPNRRYYDSTNEIIDCLRQELALNDYLLENELESAVLSEFDRNLLTAELYKERLMTLATSSRSQRMIVQMGAAMVRCAQANQIGRRAKRPNYNQYAVPYQPNNYRHQYWGGPSYNNNSYNSGIQRPIRKNRKRKHTAPRINPIPVKVSPGQANTGINTVKTTTASVISTSTQVNTYTAQVKTACAQVSPITGPARVTAMPAKVTATPTRVIAALAKPTALSAKTPTTCTVTSTQTKTTITSPQTETSTLPKTCSSQAKTTATSVKNTATLVVTTATQVKAIAAPTTTSTPIKTTTTSVKNSLMPIICTPAPFSLIAAPVNNSTVIIKPTAARESIFAQDIDVPIPPKKSKIPVKISVPSKTSVLTQTIAVPKTVSVPSKSMVPVKKESDVGVAPQKVPSLFSLNMPHIKMQFAEADRITIKATDDIPSEPTANVCSEAIKNEPIIDDDCMYDDLEDHI